MGGAPGNSIMTRAAPLTVGAVVSSRSGPTAKPVVEREKVRRAAGVGSNEGGVTGLPVAGLPLGPVRAGWLLPPRLNGTARSADATAVEPAGAFGRAATAHAAASGT